MRRQILLSRTIVRARSNILVHQVRNVAQMRHFAFGHAHVGEYGAKLGLIHLVDPDIFAGRERVVVRKVKYRAREQYVPVHLRRAIVLRCSLLVRVNEMGEVRLRVESEKSVKRSGR